MAKSGTLVKRAVLGLSLAGLLGINDAGAVEWQKTPAGFAAVHEEDNYVLAGVDFNEGYIKKTEPKKEIKKPVDRKKYELFEDVLFSWTSSPEHSMKKILGFQYFETEKQLVTYSIEQSFNKIDNADAREIKSPGKPVYTQGRTKVFLSRSSVMPNGSLDEMIKVEYEGNPNGYLQTYVDYTAKPEAEVDAQWVPATKAKRHLKLFEQLQEEYAEKFSKQGR
ncbi:hypothetical protein HYT92_02930 [Candidatus Pacearchaeota archaeon]|nr:hypothetical protein [Candidatus Pacearchaeota archaeon]